MFDWLLHLLGLVGDPPHDEGLESLDKRSRTAVKKVAEQLNDEDLRRLAGMSVVVSHYSGRRHERQRQ